MPSLTATDQNAQPNWAGDRWTSRFVNLLIHNKPLYALMKRQARRVVIKRAETHGISWSQTVRQLEASDIKQSLSQITDPAVTYPDYYRVAFHAYEDGNLCWLAAFEAEPATYSVPLRIWPTLTCEEAQMRLRGNIHRILDEFGPNQVEDVLDIGCSVGISTRYLHQHYTQRQQQPVRTIGLDLSPYMLAVANYRDAQHEIVEWRHAQAEKTGLPGESFDVVSLQYVLHELPQTATAQIFREIFRLLRAKGSVLLVDVDPKSPAVRSMSAVASTLMKSTEPWTDDYYTFDVETALREAGFISVSSRRCNPFNYAIVATK